VSDQQPPAGGPSYGLPGSSGSPSYGAPPPPPTDSLTLGGGAWQDPAGDRGSRRKWWYVGAGAVATVALVAGGTIAAATVFKVQRDPGPAAALPADTLAYAAFDLNPSAGQKIEAIRALRKLPSFLHDAKLDPTTDLREKAVQGALGTDHCGLSWSKDFAPWVGTDLAAAIVPAGSDGPQPVVVVGVKDAGAAKKALPRLLACDGAGDHTGYSLQGSWLVLAKSKAVATEVADGGQRSALAADDDFTTWTDRTGDPGVATFYASKDAGKTLAGHLDQLASTFGATEDRHGRAAGEGHGSPSAYSPSAYQSRLTVRYDDNDTSLDPLAGICGADSATEPGDPSSMLDAQKAQLAQFQGGAATLRFAGGGFELESASQQADAPKATSSSGAAAVASLPVDTVFAAGGALPTGWFDRFVTGFAAGCGATKDQVVKGLSQMTGLTLPGDLDTLLGGGFAVSVSGKIDPEAIANSTQPTDVPIGVKVMGDPDRIAAVLAKLPAGQTPFLASSKGDGAVAIGPDQAYRTELLKDGGLGDTATFKDAIPHADRASAVAYLDFSRLAPLISKMSGNDPQGAQVKDNLTHLGALGMSTWQDGAVTHALVRLSTR